MKITAATAELFFQREGVTNKPIRKPENLPECLIALPARTWADQHDADKFGSHIRKNSGMGFFIGRRYRKGVDSPFVSHGTDGTETNESSRRKKAPPYIQTQISMEPDGIR
jgi:hypothetical protein